MDEKIIVEQIIINTNYNIIVTAFQIVFHTLAFTEETVE